MNVWFLVNKYIDSCAFDQSLMFEFDVRFCQNITDAGCGEE